jgi:hypothetical protein
MGSKWTLVADAGESAVDVIALKVLHCRPYGGGPHGKVPCGSVESRGVPYAFCARFGNDGAGNDVAIGALKRDAVTDALGLYTGCPAGQVPQSKLDAARAAGFDPRGLSGIVTIDCQPASGPVQKAAEIPCPAGPSPYGTCLGTTNDGHGNAVMLGLVMSRAPDDPYALYGECNSATGIQPGFFYKADALTAAGVPLDNVRGVDTMTCQVPWGMGTWLPQDLEVWACESLPGILPLQAARYDYCIVGTDAHGNGLVFGVHGRR